MKRNIWLLLLLCCSCTPQPHAPTIRIISIKNKSIKFTGLDYAIISEINRDSVQEMWTSLLPVYRMPADTDMKDYQPVQPGVYQLRDSAVVFTPDTPFIKGQSYFVRCFQYSQDNATMSYLQGKKKLGKAPFVDLVFK